MLEGEVNPPSSPGRLLKPARGTATSKTCRLAGGRDCLGGWPIWPCCVAKNWNSINSNKRPTPEGGS
eukprot:2916394-Heterocapsa_arctica.AAC.1